MTARATLVYFIVLLGTGYAWGHGLPGDPFAMTLIYGLWYLIFRTGPTSGDSEPP